MADRQPEFLDHMRQFVADGESQRAVEQILLYVSRGNRELYNEATLLSSRFADLSAQQRRGLITEEHATVLKNALAQSALGLLDEIQRTFARRDLPIPERPVMFDSPPLVPLEKIFASSHLKTISWLERGLTAASSVCRVLTPRGLGTGFLIGPRRLITNWHVIPDANTAENSYAEFNYQENVDRSIGPSYSYRIVATNLRSSERLDYCVAEVVEDSANSPLARWGHLTVDASQQVRPGDHVPIIQHPHGGLKQIAVTANQVANVFDYRLQYMTDTLPGSSGSPVFNDDWAVIAIHHAGGNLLTSARGDRMFANEGILMKYIVEEIG